MKHRPYTHGLVLVIIFLAAGYATITGGTFRTHSQAFAAPITGLTLPGVSSSIPTTNQATLRTSPINKTLMAVSSIPPGQAEEARQLASIIATPTAQPAAPAEDAVVRAAAVAPPPPEKPYTVYAVQPGDTISSIAQQHNLASATLIDNNAEIQNNTDFLKLGQSIIIPAGNGIVYEIRLGETLSDIATRFGVSADDIKNSPVNGIATADNVKEAQLVFVPGGKQPARAAPVAVAAPTPGAGSASATASDGSSTSASAGIVAGGPKSSAGLIWPVVGPISSPYGASHPLGIDVDGYNLTGAPIAAATAGTVVFAGGNACCSYGLYVVVMSASGIETLYAHLSSIAVSQGQTVAQGEEVGIIGSTGYSTGTHLHFEVIDNGVRQNPSNYLP